jgi:hypothetical protein
MSFFTNIEVEHHLANIVDAKRIKIFSPEAEGYADLNEMIQRSDTTEALGFFLCPKAVVVEHISLLADEGETMCTNMVIVRDISMLTEAFDIHSYDAALLCQQPMVAYMMIDEHDADDLVDQIGTIAYHFAKS